MIQFNNHTPSAITYSGHSIIKVYGGCSDSPVWEKQEPTPPTGIKWGYLDWSGNTHNYPCDSSSTLTQTEVNNALYEIYESGTTLNYYIHSAWIGDCVTTIGDRAFTERYTMSAITIPNSVTSIGVESFDLSDIRSLVLPSGLTTVSDYLCDGCRSLSSVTFPSGLTSIEQYSFAECSSLLDITIPASVTSIGDGAFKLDNDQRNANALANRRITILATTPPTIPYANVFGDTDVATYKIYVPSESLQAYKTASHWDYIANRIMPIE